ncbi:hypothetical protein LPW36_07935 [Jinshanibacter sp. LJY008]|uniref:Uncharacterized protein n=1 Tax=Limnobaculum eriocheiris TaxID=2897391 RepID=A0A9X1MVY4_9GAMM|nr:hypothetical protein [Limnobaculum eriocheiris]MCD1125934.1 hypothetical protein [Limnobaculum eriocheiris]
MADDMPERERIALDSETESFVLVLALPLIVFGFKSYRIGNNFFLGLLVHPYGVQSMPPSIEGGFLIKSGDYRKNTGCLAS